MATPLLISVITPVKNGEALLQRAIDSLGAQTWPHEHIIVDGMSTDRTSDIIESNRQHISKVIRTPDNSATEAVNRGVSASTGDIICLLMADDFFPENALDIIGRSFTERDDLDVLAGAAEIIDETQMERKIGSTLEADDPPLNLERILGAPYAAAFSFRRELWDKLGGFQSSYRYGADRDFMMRCFLSRATSSVVANKTYVYSVNEHSDTLVERPDVIESFLEDHLCMAKSWLRTQAVPHEATLQIKRWRRLQVNELLVRKFKRGRVSSMLRLFMGAIARDPTVQHNDLDEPPVH